MSARMPRLAVRALILDPHDRVLLVNAWPQKDAQVSGLGGLWCAPGGGVEAGESLPDCLRREVLEECGLVIEVGAPALINEFHDPARGFHQVEIFFRCRPDLTAGAALGAAMADWQDPAGIVTRRQFFTSGQMRKIRFKPDSLPAAVWGTGVIYDPLEQILPPDDHRPAGNGG